jgi:hypothetical protein
MSGSLIPNGKQQYLDANGKPLAGGKVYYYIPSTTTLKNTYQDLYLTILNTNPIVLDSAGECIAWGAGAYRQVVYDVNGNIIWDQNTFGVSPAGANFISQEEIQTATQGQTVFTLTTITYTPGINSLVVFVNGSKQLVGTNYTETASNQVTFTSGLNVGDVVDFYASLPASAQNMSNAVTVAYTPPFTGSVATNVQAKLAQTVSVKDFGAVGDGSTDDTNAIQNAITVASGLNAITIFPAGTYNVTGISLNSLSYVNLQSNGATLFLINSSNKPVIKLVSCAFTRVDGFTINGNKNNQTVTLINRDNGSGILITLSNYSYITNNIINSNVAGASINYQQGGIAGGSGVVVPIKVVIDNNTINNSGVVSASAISDGIFCNSDNCMITRNKIYACTDHAIAHDFGQNQNIQGNFIDGNSITPYGIGAYGVSDVNISENIIQNVGYAITYDNGGGTSGWTSTSVNIINNNIRGLVPSLIIGDANGIGVTQSGVSVYFDIIGNTISGGTNSISTTGNVIRIFNNLCVSPVSRCLNVTGNNVYIDNNQNIGGISYINSIPNSKVYDYTNLATYKRTKTISATHGTNSNFYKLQTLDTSGTKTCTVKIDAWMDGGYLTYQIFKVVATAGTVTNTALSYIGDYSNILITINNISSSTSYISAQPLSGTANITLSVEVLSASNTNPFYLTEPA